MAKLSSARVLALVLFTAAVGCADPDGPQRTQKVPASSGHGYAILYEVLGQERQVSKLLLIKRERDELEEVIDEIAKTCHKAYDQLGEFAEADPSLELTDTGLPLEEVRTREALAVTRREQLLAASGPELELQLLLTQNEALAYMSHMADTLSRSEPDPARLAFIREFWRDATRLRGDVVRLLRHKELP